MTILHELAAMLDAAMEGYRDLDFALRTTLVPRKDRTGDDEPYSSSIDAALAWANRVDEVTTPASLGPIGERLYSAARAYQNGPVKTCGTCRWNDSRSFCGAKDCLGSVHAYRGWEAKL